MTLHEQLQRYFGYETFRPGQQDVIEAVLRGEDVVAVLPTGMGKSLCYQLPTKLLPHATLIVSPLLSLMQDQVEQLKKMGEKRAVALNSFLNRAEKEQVLATIAQYEFIFTSPEMLQQPRVRAMLERLPLSLIVVDEAHCLSQWGFDFRPDYLQIIDAFKAPRPPVLALSATATTRVLADIKHYLQLQQPFELLHSVDRPNIRLMREHFDTQEQKLAWAFSYAAVAQGAGIFYTQSRKKCEQYARALVERGVRVAYYHAGMDIYDRQLIQQQFLAEELDWVVATNAFGMGVHKANIRHVLHDVFPATVANYMQEIGRAGRDGEPSIAVLLYAQGDEQLVTYVATEDVPSDMHVELYVQQQDPLELVRSGMMRETQFRVLHYWLQQKNVQEVKHLLAGLRLEKREQIEAMRCIVQQTTCIREAVVAAFGQQLHMRPPQCCTNCKATYELHVTHEKKASLAMDATWQERLNALFPL